MGFTPFAKRLWAASVFAALSVLMSDVVAQIFPLNPSRYRIISAPEFPTGHGGSARAFEWVDNDRLLFLVSDRKLSQTEQREGRTVITKAVPTIHLWDFRAGTITRYRDEPLSDYLCVIDGRVYYGLKRNGSKVTIEGLFGEERERPATPPRTDTNGRAISRGFNRFACKEYWYADVLRPNGGRAILLRDEHGIYERVGLNAKGEPDTRRSSPPFKWWRHLAGNAIEIPFPQENINDPLGYSNLTNGYLFQHRQDRQQEGMRSVFFLWVPNTNTVRRLDVLGNENWTALSDPRITRAGLIVKNPTPPKRPRDEWDPGPSGIYLFTGSPVDEFIDSSIAYDRGSQRRDRPFIVEQLISGPILEISQVSPDGCKVAVVTDPLGKRDRIFRFETIDLCSTER
jgi:hypothetical protein